jgi:glycosyltransferase involved in cell wall biosynthesis
MHYERPHVRMCHGYPPFGAHAVDHYKRPELAVFNSQSMYESFHYDGPSIVCHPVLRVDEFATTPGTAIGLANNSAEKGAELFDQLARHMPEHEFLAIKAGHGTRYDMHRRNLTVMEKTSNMRDDFYSKIRILLMPSLTETWGKVALEAMCSGIPVIAHPTPGLLEACGDAGIFHLRHELDDWITAIERLSNPAEYLAQSLKCLKRADEIANDDSADRFVQALEALL